MIAMFSRLFVVPLIAGAMSAADFSGIWVGQIETRNGVMQDIAFKFSQKGATLTGKLYGDYASAPLTDGIITGDSITFVVISRQQAGNEITQTTFRFCGSLRDGGLELTRERESATNMSNGNAVQFRGTSTQKFRLKRLI